MDPRVSILVAACMAMAPVVAAGAEVRVALEDIPGIAMSRSPNAVVLDSELGLARAERDLSLRWSNPSLVWEMEEVGDGGVSFREWSIGLEKEFAMPWSYAKKKGASDLRLESAGRRHEASRWRLISRLRHGYVTLSLRDAEGEILESFEEIIGDASRVISERKDQGTVSGVDKRLIDMSLLSVRARIIETRAARRDVMDAWKAAMGIPAGDTVVLVSRPGLGAAPISAAGLDAGGSSDIESRRLAAEALKEDIGFEKGELLPSISIAGGYKSVEDRYDGFVLGISLPIPLLNRNSGGVDRASAGHRMAQAELDLYETARERRIARLLLAASETSALLERYHGDFAGISGHVADLAASYREGWIDLGDFLEGIKTYSDGIEQYFDLLEGYHGIVFELEELTEREIFSPGAARKEESGS